MRQRNTYSRIIYDLAEWEQEQKGVRIQLFHHCVENDITSFLINYSQNRFSTKRLGTALSESGLSRDELQLIANINDKIESEEEIISQVDDILEILRTDYLDLVFFDVETSSEVLLPAIERLLTQGKIVETGVFDHTQQKNSASIDGFPVNANLSVFKSSPSAYKTLGLKKDLPEEPTKMLFLDSEDWENSHEALREFSEKFDLSPKELLFAWLTNHPAHFHPIIRGNSEKVIDSAKKAYHTSLIKEDWEKLPQHL